MASIAGKRGGKKKARKCPFLTRRIEGAWLKLSCSSPDPCKDLRCQANPGYQEQVPDGGE